MIDELSFNGHLEKCICYDCITCRRMIKKIGEKKFIDYIKRNEKLEVLK